MKRISRWVRVGVLVAGVLSSRVVSAEQGVIAGADLGFVGPLKQLRDRTTTGGVLGPFAGYMFNDYVGGVGQVEILGAPTKNRINLADTDSTWAFGAHVGPRLALPFNGGELYATWQGGVFTGLAAQTPIDGTSWGYVTGGGMNARITNQLVVGAFLRYNRLDQRATGTDGRRDDVQYLTGGLSLIYNALPAPPAPPPAKVVAQAEPAPPPPPVKKKIVLRGVNFDFDKSNIRADARPVLDEAIATLKEEGVITIIAEGHTDGLGTDEYNQALSLRRAEAVRDYLVAGGVAASRITVEGFGKSRPVASNKTDDGRAQNRRVELRIRGE